MVDNTCSWKEEIGRAADTLDAIRRCVAPSPRRDKWLRETEAALTLMVRHYASTRTTAADARVIEQAAAD